MVWMEVYQELKLPQGTICSLWQWFKENGKVRRLFSTNHRCIATSNLTSVLELSTRGTNRRSVTTDNRTYRYVRLLHFRDIPHRACLYYIHCV